MKPITKTLFVIIIVCIILSDSAKSDDFKIIKDRVVAELMKSTIDDGQVKTIISKINEDGSFNDIIMVSSRFWYEGVLFMKSNEKCQVKIIWRPAL